MKVTPSITYAVTVCNEIQEIQKLISHLLKYKKQDDSIVVLFDEKGGTEDVEEFLRANSINGEFNWHKGKFDGHFANWKNKLNSLCNGDYIFQVDADEIPHETLMYNLPEICNWNSGVDTFIVSRINIVNGITPEHIKRWGWTQNEEGWINFNDPQLRVYKNSPNIKWEGKVHERIVGYKTIANLPINQEYCLRHIKEIARQEKQNSYYDKLLAENKGNRLDYDIHL